MRLHSLSATRLQRPSSIPSKTPRTQPTAGLRHSQETIQALKAAALSSFPPQNHAGLYASTKALCVCVRTFISCTDAHDKYSFLPAYGATWAPLELPRHAWTSVVAAKQGKKPHLDTVKPVRKAAESPTQTTRGICKGDKGAQLIQCWSLHPFFFFFFTSKGLPDPHFSRDIFPGSMFLKCIVLCFPAFHKRAH